MPRYGGAFGKGYVIMAGGHGHMPDYHAWAPNKKDAIEIATDEIHYTLNNRDDIPLKKSNRMRREINADIRKHLHAELPNRIFGWEYIEIADAEEVPDEDY